jgi:hypothetical protein
LVRALLMRVEQTIDHDYGQTKGVFVKRELGASVFLCLFFLSLNAVATADDVSTNGDTVALVGLSEQGEEVVKTIPLADYTQSVGAMVSTVQSSVEPALTMQEISTPANHKWELRTVAVGCTITAQIGLGPIWSISPQARLRIIFSNSTSPVYPD